MVDQVKAMQRADPAANEQWYAYCEAYGNNVRDPSKHDVSFIQSFITQYNAGARLEFKEGKELARMIKMGQKKSQAWKTCWEMYANTKPKEDGKPKHDPEKHDLNFLEGFFDYVGSMAAGGGAAMGMMGMGMGMGMEPPAKRMKTGIPHADAINSGSPTVVRIKAYQKMGQQQKDAWHTYCDTNLGGNRDPARHDEAVLQAFCTQYGVP